MKVAVLLKTVPDLSRIRYSRSERRLVESGERLLAPISENTLEVARQIKASSASAELVGVLSGSRAEVSALTKAIAFGLDQAVMIETDAGDYDHLVKARLLKAALDKVGSVNILVVGGATDAGGGGQIGVRVGEALGFDHVETVAEALKGSESCTFVVEQDSNEPRIPNVMAVMKAGKKEIKTWKAEELVAEGERTPATTVLREEWVG